MVISKIMLHTGNHLAEITPNDVVDYHRAAPRCAMVHRWLSYPTNAAAPGSASVSLASTC